MGKNGLTPIQNLIFQEVIGDDFLRSQFYFTGGTALKAFHLNHRESEDLDFFSEKKFDPRIIVSKMHIWSLKHRFKPHVRQIETVNIFTLEFPKGEKLKIDFVYHPHKRLQKGLTYENFAIDSKMDIAVNKALTIMQRSAAKDFVDLYYLLNDFTVWDLISGVYSKYNIEIDPFVLGSDFTKMKEFKTLPKMLKPLSLKQLQIFFIQKSQELARASVK